MAHPNEERFRAGYDAFARGDIQALRNEYFTEDAIWDTTPEPIPQGVQDLLYEARPPDALTASESLPFTAGGQRYFMFSRAIGEWSRALDVRRDLGQ